MHMENSRIIPKKYQLLDHLSLILLHSLRKKTLAWYNGCWIIITWEEKKNGWCVLI